jgi:hypothetical protein
MLEADVARHLRLPLILICPGIVKVVGRMRLRRLLRVRDRPCCFT